MLLTLDEANELLSAWASRRAGERGIRMLLIKGRALSDYGLRAARTSADVDVLVEPQRFEEYCDAVATAGWEEFPSTFASQAFTLHSRSFRRDGWPNSFDVHHTFPGFLIDPADAFDALWARRGSLPFAGHDCAVPDRSSSILILALHSLRGTHKQARHRSELDALRSLALTGDERRDLARAAHDTGAAAALRDVLPALGVTVDVSDAELRTPAYREWHRKTAEARGAAASWLLLFAQTPWRDKPAIAGRALWPSGADFALDHPEVPDRPLPQITARIARWGRGIRRLPHALSALLKR